MFDFDSALVLDWNQFWYYAHLRSKFRESKLKVSLARISWWVHSTARTFMRCGLASTYQKPRSSWSLCLGRSSFPSAQKKEGTRAIVIPVSRLCLLILASYTREQTGRRCSSWVQRTQVNAGCKALHHSSTMNVITASLTNTAPCFERDCIRPAAMCTCRFWLRHCRHVVEFWALLARQLVASCPVVENRTESSLRSIGQIAIYLAVCAEPTRCLGACKRPGRQFPGSFGNWSGYQSCQFDQALWSKAEEACSARSRKTFDTISTLAFNVGSLSIKCHCLLFTGKNPL